MNTRLLPLTSALVLLLAPTLLRAEVPLDQVTQAQIRARMKQAFEGTDSKIPPILKEPQVDFRVAPEGLDFVNVGGKLKLVWRYTALKPLDVDQKTVVLIALRKVLIEGLVQYKDPIEKTALLTTEDVLKLTEVLELKEARWSDTIGGDPIIVVYAFPSCCCCCCCSPWVWYAPPPCAVIDPCPAGAVWAVPVRVSVGGPAAPRHFPVPAPPPAALVSAPDPNRVVPRAELLKGKTESDWVALYDAGFRQYWAGKYAQAAESCAAAAQLKDDARAWYYLSFSLRALGDTTGARDAARYAAALDFADPGQAQFVREALKGIQDREREKLTALQNGVSNDRAASDVLAARPKLVAPHTTVVAGAQR